MYLLWEMHVGHLAVGQKDFGLWGFHRLVSRPCDWACTVVQIWFMLTCKCLCKTRCSGTVCILTSTVFYMCEIEVLYTNVIYPCGSTDPSSSCQTRVPLLSVFSVLLFPSRSLSQDRSSPSPWTDLLSQPHKHKELANYCSMLQEHYHQSYVKGDLCPPTRMLQA